MKPHAKFFRESLRLIVINLILALAPAMPAQVITGPVTNSANGHLYYLLAATTWPEAENQAISFGGYLATVNDLDENEWIVSEFSNFGGVGRTLWLGLNDSVNEGQWAWSSGEPAAFVNWGPGEPNSGGGFYPDEDHVAMQPPGDTLGMWNDAPSNLVYSAVVEVAGPIPPMIVAQPQNLTVYVGESGRFEVSSVGTPTLSYQWRLYGTNIPGATANLLVLTNVQVSDAGPYSLLIANDFGSVVSDNAVLIVNPPPACAPAPAGVLSWWSGSGHLLDIAGTNSGRLAGNVMYGPGRVGSAFIFDGNRDGVQIGTATNLQLQNFSIEAWIKRASTTTVSFNGNGFGSIFSMGGSGGYWFHLKSDSSLALGKLQFSDVASTAQIVDTNWHHVAVTKAGTTVSFFLDGMEHPAAAYDSGGFIFSAPGCIGAWLNPASLVDNSFYGSIDEVAVYNRALTAIEIQSIYASAMTGKCPVAAPPTVVSGPHTTNVLAGANVTLSVLPSGALPLGYQWRFNGQSIIGATNAVLTLTNVQFAHVGNYSVMVTNEFGSALSADAALTVTFPAAPLRIANTNAMAGSLVVVPITITANGNESVLGFSLNFNTQRLAYANTLLGSGATGSTLLVNASMTATGRLGLVVVRPYQSNFASGTQEVARVIFNSLPLLGSQSATTPISFADQPITRELLDAQFQTLGATYSGSTVTLLPTIFEGDVVPRTNGNQNISAADWLLLGRFVARLEVPATTNEFQRTDCAPRASQGDGQLKATDWVQAGRYLTGLDTLTVIGGPSSETTPNISNSSNDRLLTVTSTNVVQDQTVDVQVKLQAQGNEGALGFTLSYHSAALAFAGIEPGSGTVGGTIILNTNQVAVGRLGLAVAQSPGGSFNIGLQEIVRVKFRVTGPPGVVPLTISDHLVTRCVSDVQAGELPVGFVNGSLTIEALHPLPTLAISQVGSNAIVAWPEWAGDFVLQASDVLGGSSTNWINIYGPLQTNGSEISHTMPSTNQIRFFRLSR
jgi:hypothetical protein